MIYRVAQEALTNVLRHADGDARQASLARATARVVLRVRDDGRGLPRRRAGRRTASRGCASARC